ncbi:hypothetical protein EJ08DRAFT_583775 [Tothia fuscella]|uniref:MOSC domain-containing protein n=1 Tax=Tothia fuscella TaxID=1048955 RepID=A0A9P4NYJ9_9PEZI|nr:hypothetical protein EJ08DRAFT_583775 [Tothia fuscella]
MVLLVFTAPFIYRQLWIAFFEILYIYRQTEGASSPPGCRRIGDSGIRNLSKEYNKATTGTSPAPRVAVIFQYPLKSGFPIEFQEATITPTGFKHDRQFCFAKWFEPTPVAGFEVKEGDRNIPEKGTQGWWSRRQHWEFLTQRSQPYLTLIKTEVWVPDLSAKGYSADAEYVKSEGCLVVSFPFSPPNNSLKNYWSNLAAKLRARDLSAEPMWTFFLPLNPSVAQIKEKGYGYEKVRIFRDEPSALDMTSEIPNEMLAMLKYCLNSTSDLRLFRVDIRHDRPLYKCAPKIEQLGYQARVGYQDSYPISLQNMASISEVESQVPTSGGFTPDARRFRGNIYIAGLAQFDEEDWTFVRIGKHEFHVSCRVTRCALPNTDPDTGIKDKKSQPFSYIKKNRAIDEGSTNGCLGMNLVPTKASIGGNIRVGDKVEILKRGKHRFVADASPEAHTPII